MRTIDTHTHWYPREWIELLAREGAAHGARLERGESGYRLQVPGLANAFTDAFVELGPRLAEMDAKRVEVHVLSLTMPMVYWAPPPFGLALSQAFNDAASAAHRAHPDRFLAFAMVPMQDPALALAELERASKLAGLRGLYLATSFADSEIDDRRYWDVYAKCEEIGWPIFLHPVSVIGAERLQRFWLKNLLGNPYDTGVAAANLIFGGVLDAFPKLEVNLPHAGGTLPGLIGRLDHGAAVRPELAHLKERPSAYLRRFTYDTIGHDDRINANLIRQVGADRVLLGSDYCFDMGLERPVEAVERLGLGDRDREMILGRTAARLLRMES
ncbi:MAG TPA: amidohydrolase family protein [Usitatibacter sp.]|nr:amidohydrolase family protein [Usitatibacter sp.]